MKTILLAAVLALTTGSALAAFGSAHGASVVSPPQGPDFSLTSTPSRTAYPGAAATYEVTVKPLKGFAGTVSLSVQRLPAATTGAFTRTEIRGGSGTATLIVTTTPSTALGNSRFLITGTSGNLSHTVSPAPWLWVVPKPASYFTLEVSAQSPSSVGPGGTATYTVTVDRVAFAGHVKLTVSSDLPPGVTAALNPSLTTGSSATLTLTAGPSTPTGNFQFAVIGRSGILASEADGVLEVSDGGTTSFQIAGSPPPGLLLYPGGGLVPVNLAFTNPNGSPITVQSVIMSVTGTSAGGCGAGNFAVAEQLTAQPVVPANSTRSLQDLGIPQPHWPKLQMLDSGNQDACRSATVNLSFTGTAQG